MSPFSSLASLQVASNGTDNPTSLNPGEVLFFTPYERKGVAVMAAAGVLSCTLVSTLLLYIMFSALSSWPNRHPGSSDPFTKKQIAVFVICLLISDLIQSISGITQVKWAVENRIYEGRACSVQAATLVMGDLGSTVWSCVIAAHTFSGLALGKHWPRWVVFTTVVIGWLFVIILTVIGPTTLPVASKGPFFSIAGTWCFISSEYAIARLIIHYVPLFAAAFIIFIFYGLVFLVLRGSISFTQHGSHTPSRRIEDVFSRERIIIAKRMLWYPIAYLTCIFPIAIVRLIGLKEENVPEPVWIFSMFFLFSLGAVDSIIYTTTRKLIKPINFQTHMRTFSSDNSSMKARGSLSRNNTVAERSEFHGSSLKPRLSDMDQRENSPSELEASEHLRAPKSKSGAYQPSGAIHVTLERIQEVI
ncbi:hypothetical protein K439DRAFT_918942 [Ramaria rubella]|nr:hypothetical protein K439DRAFT_918942 [Ramaria rubella]